MESLAYDIIIFVSLNAQQKLMGSLGPSASSYMDEFILLPKLPLSLPKHRKSETQWFNLVASLSNLTLVFVLKQNVVGLYFN